MEEQYRGTGAPALWRRFKEQKDAKARDELVLTYAPIVKYVAGRMMKGLPGHVEEAELISYGLLGLISAIDRFEPARNIKFETYAVIRIKGAIVDELRALDRLPRSVRKDAGRIERASAHLAHRLRRTPRDGEIAAELGMSMKKLHESRRHIANCSIVALDELRPTKDESGDTVTLLETIQDEDALDPEREIDVQEQRTQLADAIANLPEKEKVVIALYYYEDLTLREIGEVLGVTESRVSQLRTKAMLRLKARLSAPEWPVARTHAPSTRQRVARARSGQATKPARSRRAA